MRYKDIKKWQDKITDYLKARPGQYVKIDDIRIDLLCPVFTPAFDRAWRELAICGTVVSNGNSIRINQ